MRNDQHAIDVVMAWSIGLRAEREYDAGGERPVAFLPRRHAPILVRAWQIAVLYPRPLGAGLQPERN